MKKIFIITLWMFPALVFSATETATNAFDLGIQYYQQEKFLMAVSSFKKAIRSGNDEPEVYSWLANSQIGLGDYDDALANYKTAYDSSFDFDFQSYLLYNMAATYYVLSDYSNSITYFGRSYELNPEYVQVYWYKGLAYFQLRNKTKVITEWENYLSVAPDGEQSENISNALLILRAENFNFDSDEAKTIAKNASGGGGGSDTTTTTNDDGNKTGGGDDTGGGGGKKFVTGQDLIDIEGVLESTEPSNKGKASDTEMEDIEM